MDQDHREYLEDRGSHQLEVEAYEREVSMRVGGDGWKLTRGTDGGFLIEVPGWLDERQVLTLANTLLSEIEMDRCSDGIRWDEDPEYPRADWRDEVWREDTTRSYQQWVEAQREQNHCSVCNDQRVIVAGPDENGQYDTDDCPACSVVYPNYPGDDEPRLTGHLPNPETEDL